MTASASVANLGAGVRFVMGDVRGARPRLPRCSLVAAKQTSVYLHFRNTLPPGEFLRPAASDWNHQLCVLEQLLECAAKMAEHSPAWPAHSFFGKLSTRAWGVLGYSHFDHHLGQFDELAARE